MRESAGRIKTGKALSKEGQQDFDTLSLCPILDAVLVKRGIVMIRR